MKTRTHTLPVNSDERKLFPLWRGLFRYAPAALAAAARVSMRGSQKHNPGQPMHHSRWKSTDHLDCFFRHAMDLEEDFGHGRGYDEHGEPQVGYMLWRALMFAQEWLEINEGAPTAPAAVLEGEELPAVSPAGFRLPPSEEAPVSLPTPFAQYPDRILFRGADSKLHAAAMTHWLCMAHGRTEPTEVPCCHEAAKILEAIE